MSSRFADDHRIRTVRRSDLPLMQMPTREQLEHMDAEAFCKEYDDNVQWVKEEVLKDALDSLPKQPQQIEEP